MARTPVCRVRRLVATTGVPVSLAEHAGKWVLLNNQREVLYAHEDPLRVAEAAKNARRNGVPAVHVFRVKLPEEPEFEGGYWL